MLNRIPTLLLSIYIVNGVLASHKSRDAPKGWIPDQLLPGLTPNQQISQVKKLNEVPIKDSFKLRNILAPRKFHLRTKKLMKRLGGGFDPFWMSVQQPGGFLNVSVNGRKDPDIDDQWVRSVNPLNLIKSLRALNLSMTSPTDRRGNQLQADKQMAEKRVLTAVQNWLVEKATCPVRYVWEDMGVQFWPRYIRMGFCSEDNIPENMKARVRDSLKQVVLVEQDCSWPPGMFCVGGNAKQLRMLKWDCQPSRAARKRQSKGQVVSGFPSVPNLGSDHPEAGRTSAVSGTKGSFQRTLESVGSGRRFAATGGSLGHGQQTSEQGGEGRGNQVSAADGHDLGSILSQINSQRSKRSAVIWDDLVGYIDTHSRPQRDSAHPSETPALESEEHYRQMSWKELRRKFKVKCRWQKITYPVTQSCHCSC